MSTAIKERHFATCYLGDAAKSSSSPKKFPAMMV